MSDIENKKEKIEDLADFVNSANSYQKLSDKYEDIKSSAYTLVTVGGIGIILMILECTNIIKLPISQETKWLFNSVMGGIFIIFVIAGIVSFMHAKKVKIDADIENQKISDIKLFASKNISREDIDADNDLEQPMELLYFNRADYIKDILMHKFEDVDESLIIELTEQIYQDLYEN